MTRDEELAAIEAHVAAKGVTRWTSPGEVILDLANTGEALDWARRNGVHVRHHKGDKLSIANGPPMQKSRFVAAINRIRARQLGASVPIDGIKLAPSRHTTVASKLPGSVPA